MGWQRRRTHRLDPDRVDRHWLVLAVATLRVLAYGTRVEEALLRGRAPGRVRTPPLEPAAPVRVRSLSVFLLGLSQTRRLLVRGYGWARVQRGPCRDRTHPASWHGWIRRPGSSFFAQRCGLGIYLPLSDTASPMPCHKPASRHNPKSGSCNRRGNGATMRR